MNSGDICLIALAPLALWVLGGQIQQTTFDAHRAVLGSISFLHTSHLAACVNSENLYHGISTCGGSIRCWFSSRCAWPFELGTFGN
jgi:hypothetical protein